MATDWQTECLVPQNQPSLDSARVHSDRALQNTSGNVQSYADHLTHGDVAAREEQLHQLGFKYAHAPHHSQPMPGPSLYHQQQAAVKLHARKLRRLHSVAPGSSQSRRARSSYLKSQKYLEYRARPRRDTGKDGEPVWSDELEDAFQQGKSLTTLSWRLESNCWIQLLKQTLPWAGESGLNGESRMAEMS